MLARTDPLTKCVRLGYRSVMRAGTSLIPLLALAAALAGCRQPETGPVEVVAIGKDPAFVNPNLQPLDPPSAFLLQAAAQGLVRFDASGEIEPALAERWIVSDEGLRYTFRLAGAEWRGGGRITAEQVAQRLRAAASPASRNPLKPVLGAIDEIIAMTDDVLEISLKSPRPNFLQLLAQPELAVLRRGEGSGPYQAEPRAGGALQLVLPRPDRGGDEAGMAGDNAPDWPIILRGGPAALGVARFGAGAADLVLGGGIGDLPLARAIRPPAARLVFDPVAGLLGLSFASNEGPLGSVPVRQALSMVIDRGALAATLGVTGLPMRETILPPGVEGLAQPAAPPWSALPLDQRRAAAAAAMRDAVGETRLQLRIALPEGPGWRLVFAHLRRDWATIGVDAERVGPRDSADLRLIDEVAPVTLASWYLRHFTCAASLICDPAADEMLAAARIAPSPANRRGLLANADRILTDTAPFIPLAAPVRWSLVAPRLTGFRPNSFAVHPADELIRPAP
jgi:peptide/nickel transport system substrate-binding protein